MFWKKAYTTRSTVLALSLAIWCLPLLGCFPWDCELQVNDPGASLRVEGVLLEADGQTPVRGATVGGQSLTDGEVTDEQSPLNRDGSRRWPVTDAGAFSIRFTSAAEPCEGAPALPRPDQVDLIVLTDDCERSVSVDINEDTVVDLDPPDHILELRDPILVPACQE